MAVHGQPHESEIVDIVDMPEHNYFHGLFLAGLTIDQILAVARREQWRATLVDSGPFKVVNVWFESRQLIEFVTPELLPDHLATFGSANREHLNGQLRALEQMIAAGRHPEQAPRGSPAGRDSRTAQGSWPVGSTRWIPAVVG